MTKMSWEDSRIRDVVRDSKILWDTPSRLNQKTVSLGAETDRAVTGLRHHPLRDYNQVRRVVPRVPAVDVSDGFHYRNRNFGEQQQVQQNGFTSSFDEFDYGFHNCKEVEDPFHGFYHKYGGLIVKFKKNLPLFDGFWHTEDLMSWIAAIEDFFEEINPPEHVKCKIVWYKMKGAAYYWWKIVQNDRFSEGKNLISSWPTMKRLLLKRFMPATCSTELPSNRELEEGKSLNPIISPPTCLTKCVPQVDSGNQVIEDQEKEMADQSITPVNCSTRVLNQVNKLKEEEEMGGKPNDKSDNICLNDIIHFDACERPKSENFPMHVTIMENYENVDLNQPLAAELHLNSFNALITSTTILSNDVHAQTDELREHEEKIGSGLVVTNIIETLNGGPQASSASFILTDVPKSDRPLKYDSPTHVLHGNTSNWKTMIPKSWANAFIICCSPNIPRIRNDLGSIATIHSTKGEEPQMQTDDVASLVDEMLMLNFDPGGVYSRIDTLDCVFPKYETYLRFIILGDLTTSMSESWKLRNLPIDGQHKFQNLASNVVDDGSCSTQVYPKGAEDESWVQKSYELHGYINHKLKNWLTSKLLDAHINGSTERSLCVVSKLYTIPENHDFIVNMVRLLKKSEYTSRFALHGVQKTMLLIKYGVAFFLGTYIEVEVFVFDPGIILCLVKAQGTVLRNGILVEHVKNARALHIQCVWSSKMKRISSMAAYVCCGYWRELIHSHFVSCGIDLLVEHRATPEKNFAFGHIQEVYQFSRNMPMEPNFIISRSFVGLYGADQMLATDGLRPLNLELMFHVIISFDPGGIAYSSTTWKPISTIIKLHIFQCSPFLDVTAHNGSLGVGFGNMLVPTIISQEVYMANSFLMCFGPEGRRRINFDDTGDLDQAKTSFKTNSFQSDTHSNLILLAMPVTRGRVNPWEGWNDENNSYMFVMTKRCVVTISSCLNILFKNGRFMETLKLFHKVVNGLDPPMDLDSACEASMWIFMSSLVDELLRRRDGDDVAHPS